MESMIDHVARSLDMDVETVKRANLYQKGQVRMEKGEGKDREEEWYLCQSSTLPTGYADRHSSDLLQYLFSLGP